MVDLGWEMQAEMSHAWARHTRIAPADGDLGPEGTQTPDKADMRVSDSHTRDEAA